MDDLWMMILLVNILYFNVKIYCKFYLDFSISNDERIKSFMTYRDWSDELHDANENQWIVDQNKFDKAYVINRYGI